MGKFVNFLTSILYTLIISILITSVVSSFICMAGFAQDYNWEIYVAIMGFTNVIATVGMIFASKKIDIYFSKENKIFIQLFLTIVWFGVLVLTISEMAIKIKSNNFHGLLFYSSIVSIISTSILMIIYLAHMLREFPSLKFFNK